MNAFLEWLKSIFRSEPIKCTPPDDKWALGLSIFMCFGMLLSYIPQHVKIISRRSSDGLSPWYQLLGGLSMTSILTNTIILQFGLFKCCASVFTPGKCLESLLGIMQVLVQFLCFHFMVFLFIYYFPANRRFLVAEYDGSIRRTIEYRRALTIGASIICYSLFVITISIILLSAVGDAEQSVLTEIWADVLGVFSSIVSTVQFMPQIVKTWRLKRVGSLSLVTMAMQVPGAWILVYTLAVRPGNNVTTWITYMFTGTLQAILFIMCVIFSIRERRERKAAVNGERERLLSSDQNLNQEAAADEKNEDLLAIQDE